MRKKIAINKFTIDDKTVEKYLGKEIFDYNKETKNDIGVVTGLAYTKFGGDTLPIEVNCFKGNGNLTFGNLGDEKYFKDTEVSLYYSVIPDKSYFVASKTGYPSLNDERLVSLLQQTLHSDFQYINLYDCLTEDDYYKTDTHWKQQNLSKVVDRISSEMGFESYITNSYTETTYEPFYGVYYGQSSLPMKPDTLTYLRNDIIDQCEVYNFETNQTTGVYNTDKLNGMDAYDIYLSGATPLITITNPLAKRDKELVVFRDSFGSSLAPLFAEGYSKITLVDLRYMSSNYLEQYLTFTNQDILFLYSTLVLNNSTMLK